MQQSLKKRMLLINMMIICLSHHSSTEALQIDIIPNHHLQAGRIADGTNLALVKISQIINNCNLNAWENLAKNEFKPGYYSLTDKRGNFILNVRMSGEKWKGNTLTGRGISLSGKLPETSFIIESNGDQNLNASTWAFEISAQCNLGSVQPQEVKLYK